MDVLQLADKLRTEADAYRYLEQLRWGDRPVCPHCAHVPPGRRGSLLRGPNVRAHTYTKSSKSMLTPLGRTCTRTRAALPHACQAVRHALYR